MRNYNIDREPISSEEISTFKDFKSILRKHAQTTEDLARIKPKNSPGKIYWSIGGVATIIALSILIATNNSETEVINNKPEEVLPKEEVVVKEQIQLDWMTAIRTQKESIENILSVNTISANRVNYFNFKSTEEVFELLPNISKSDAEFVQSSLVFKVEENQNLEIQSSNDLYKLNKKGEWDKVEHIPLSMPYIEKPALLSKGDVAIQMNFNNFDGPASKYENVFWKPVNIKDLDESFFTTQWEDAKVERTSVEGIYSLTFISGEKEMYFNGYPALQSLAYEKAMKEYNSKLIAAQEKLKASPKQYSISSGIYTVK